MSSIDRPALWAIQSTAPPKAIAPPIIAIAVLMSRPLNLVRFAAYRAARLSQPGVLCARAVDRRSYAQPFVLPVLKCAFARAFQQNVFVFHVAALHGLFGALRQPFGAGPAVLCCHSQRSEISKH